MSGFLNFLPVHTKPYAHLYLFIIKESKGAHYIKKSNSQWAQKQ